MGSQSVLGHGLPVQDKCNIRAGNQIIFLILFQFEHDYEWSWYRHSFLGPMLNSGLLHSCILHGSLTKLGQNITPIAQRYLSVQTISVISLMIQKVTTRITWTLQCWICLDCWMIYLMVFYVTSIFKIPNSPKSLKGLINYKPYALGWSYSKTKNNETLIQKLVGMMISWVIAFFP